MVWRRCGAVRGFQEQLGIDHDHLDGDHDLNGDHLDGDHDDYIN